MRSAVFRLKNSSLNCLSISSLVIMASMDTSITGSVGATSGGAVAAARAHESSRVNLGARRSLARDRSLSIQPPMPFPFHGSVGRDSVH